MKDMVPVVNLGQLADCTPTAEQVMGVDLLLIRQGDQVTALQGICPHQGSLLAEGTLADGVLTCPGHGWRFDCNSGVRVDGPGNPLQVFSTDRVGHTVRVAGDELRAWHAGQGDSTSLMETTVGSRTVSQLPGPKGLPFVGNLFQLRSDRLHHDLEAWADDFGPVYSFSIGGRRVVVVGGYSEMLSILRDRPEGYRRLSAIASVNRELGIGGVFSAEGSVWQRQRRRVVAGLDPSQVRRFLPTLNRIVDRLRLRWMHCATAAQSIDAQPDLVRFTVDVTTNFVFDCDMNTLERGDDSFQEHLTRVLPTIGRRVVALFPYWRYAKLPKDRAAEHAVMVLKDVCRRFITEARTRLSHDANGCASPQNLLETLLIDDSTDPVQLSEDEIFGNSITMLLAGEDTTANTLAWIIHFLARSPAVQQRVREEAESALGRHAPPEHSRQVEGLAYLDAVVAETLRLKPPAPLLFMEPNRAVTLAGTTIPATTRLMLLLRWPCLQEEFFTDALSFHPERWLIPRDSVVYPIHRRAVWMPFGAGQRFCPGRHLAWLEMKTVIAMICRNFELLPVDAAGAVREYFSFTMMPSHVSVRLIARN